MKTNKITVAVTGLNAIDSPGPGIPFIRGLQEAKAFEARIIGLSYESLEPGLYMHDIVDKSYQIPYPSVGIESLFERLKYIHAQESLDVIIPNFDAELFSFIKLAPELKQMTGKYLSTRLPHMDLHLEILEQSPYTTLIHLTYFFDQSTEADPDTVLRVYHDSRQLEVIDLKQKYLPTIHSYDHPGLLMKWKANVFISKWLSYCLHQGHSFNPQPTPAPESAEFSSFC